METDAAVDTTLGTIKMKSGIRMENPRCPDCDVTMTLLGPSKRKGLAEFRCPKCQRAFSGKLDANVQDQHEVVSDLLFLTASKMEDEGLLVVSWDEGGEPVIELTDKGREEAKTIVATPGDGTAEDVLRRQFLRDGRVDSEDACECGEDLMDYLIWIDDEHIRCRSCGRVSKRC